MGLVLAMRMVVTMMTMFTSVGIGFGAGQMRLDAQPGPRVRLRVQCIESFGRKQLGYGGRRPVDKVDLSRRVDAPKFTTDPRLRLVAVAPGAIQLGDADLVRQGDLPHRLDVLFRRALPVDGVDERENA